MATRVRSVSRSAGATTTGSAVATGQFAASVQDLTKRFGSRAVLDGLSLDIKAGEFVAMIGRSGSVVPQGC
jgi:sulfonate transport system ATP-binding protein